MTRLGTAGRIVLAALALAALAPRTHAHEPGEDNQLPDGGTLHEIRITSITSFTAAQNITQPSVCPFPGVCLHDEIHLPVVIKFSTGEIAIDATAPDDENETPAPPGGPGGILFNTQAGPAELVLAPPCENPDGCVGGTSIYLGTIDKAGNIRFPSIGMNFELFGVQPVAMFDAPMGTGTFTDPSDPSVVAQGSAIDFATGAVTLRGVQLVNSPIIGNALQLNTIAGTIVPVPVPPVATRTLLKCEKAVPRQGGIFVKKKQDELLKCVEGLLACELADEAGGGAAGGCVAKAVERCQTAVAKIATYEAKLEEKLLKVSACGGAILSANLLVRRGGLDFGASRSQCTALGGGTATVAEIVACIIGRLECSAEESVALLAPRAGELLAAQGLTQFVAPAGCIPLFDDGDAAGADESALAKCQKAVSREGRKLVKIKQKELNKCIRPQLSCEIQDELDGLAEAAHETCHAKAALACDKAGERIATTIGKFLGKVKSFCAGPFGAGVLAGLGFDELEAQCGPIATVDDLAACLEGTVDCAVEGMARSMEPRAAEALDALRDDGGPDLLTPFPCLERSCGDGILDTGEECDPVFDPDDDCRDTCVLKVCGDGIVDTDRGEECDDGNTVSLDGCSATCTDEPFQCGNGIFEPFGNETCDDGDTHGGDGCSANCTSDETCGNGVVDTLLGEVCDDGGGSFTASLDGAQENPAVSTAATGTATFTLNLDDTLTYSVVTDVTGGTAAHIHPGFVGQNGPVLIPLAGGPTTWAGTTRVLTSAELATLRAGGYYVNVHTVANPGGEIRGQLGFAAPVSGDGCSADCHSDETCGNGRIDVLEGCDDKNTAGSDGCDGTCAFESCSFFSSAALGTRNFSIDQSTGGLFISLFGVGTPVGTIGFTSGPFALTAGATDASGTAAVTLDADVIVGMPNAGGFTQCLKFEAVGSAGSLYCCGGHPAGMSYTRDSNGTGSNGPAIELAGVGLGRRGDLLMTFRVRQTTIAGTATPGDCATATFGGQFTQIWTSAVAIGRVVRPAQSPAGPPLEFASIGQPFDCAAWTTENGVGALITADTALNALPGVDAANIRRFDDQAGD